MKLRSKITAYLLPLILLPILLTALGVYFFVVRTYEARERGQVDLRLKASFVEIRQRLRETRSRVELLAGSPSMSFWLKDQDNKPTGEKNSTQEFIRRFTSQDPHFANTTVMDAFGTDVFRTAELGAGSKRLVENESSVFKRARIVGFSQSPVFELDDGRAVTLLGSAIGEGEFLGVVILALDIKIFGSAFGTQIQNGSSFGLLDDRNYILASFGNRNIIKEIFKNVAKEGESDGTIDTFQSRPVEFQSNSYQTSILPVLIYERKSTLSPVPGERWFVGVIEPVTSPPEMRVFQMLFGLIVLLSSIAAVWISTVTAGRITRPIEKVSKATSAIAKGDHDFDLEVHTGDEVEDLARAVSDMNHDLQAYQKRIVESARLAAVGEMTSEISHEIHNRISGISLWLQHLDSAMPVEDEKREYVDEMKLGLGAFIEMLSGLKEYYKKPALNIETFELSALVSEAAMIAGEKAAGNQISIVDRAVGMKTSFNGDREMLKGVFLNIILNAVEASPTNGTVVVEIVNSSRLAVVRISDEGSGIPELEREKIFYPFYTTKASGSGLGLAISKNIIVAHEGSILVGKSENGGSVFEISLPV